MSGVPWHALQPRDIYAGLTTGEAGLASEEAARRLEKHGPNALRAGRKVSPVILFLSQFNNFLIYLLIAAATISFAIGELLNAAVIAAVMFLNAILGFVQEYKAGQSIEALGRLIVQEAFVIRDGRRIRVPASTLVPGDVVEVEAGVNVPADCRVIAAASLKADESALTGESGPASKHAATLPEDTVLGDRANMLFLGTSALDGKAVAVVVATGMDTELGRIAALVESGEKRETPMQKSIDRLGRFFGTAAVAVCLVIFIVGLIEGRPLYDMFLIAVSLAVAAIPEGLPATITIALALGVQRMAGKKAAIRKLPAVETLGSTSVICADKTGTLTQNAIVVKKIATSDRVYEVTGEGYAPEGKFFTDGKEALPASDPSLELLLLSATLCNNATFERLEEAWNILGDSTEVALLAVAAKAGVNKRIMEDACPRLLEIPFNTDTRRMATVNACQDRKYAFVKGAPEVVLGLSGSVHAAGRPVPLEERYERHFLKHNDALAGQGMRVLGFAYKELHGEIGATEVGEFERGLTYLGLVGMMDPPRPEVKESVRRCREAGIDVVMVTGDQKPTALAVARELGIYGAGDVALTGTELNDLSAAALDERIGRIKVYARTSPEQKLRIVDALAGRGEVVAMTGDGVNDAPALKRADIGVAMGLTGTDVARQAADMVLLDDNFATIVAAVEEGRRIYDNVKNVVKYFFSHNLGEVLTVFLGILLGLPLPLLAIQILWVNLITDSLPALALSVDPAGRDIMKRPPRPIAEGVVTRLMLLDMVLIGAIMAAGALYIFYAYLPRGLDLARTMVFTELIVFQAWNTLNCRSEVRSIFSREALGNGYLMLAIALSIGLQCAILYVPVLGGLFATTPLSASDWLVIVLATSSVFLVIEARKLLFRRFKIKL